MATEQTLKSGYLFGKSIFSVLNIYARFVVSYTLAFIFMIFGLAFVIGAGVPVLAQTRLIFLGSALLLLFISYLIHREKITHWKMMKLGILLGNVFGFLFNLLYLVLTTSSSLGYQLALGGIEKFIFSELKDSELNLIEGMYGFVGGIIFIMSLAVIASYGLSLKDKFKKEDKSIKAWFSVILSIIAAFCLFLTLFLLIAFYPAGFKFIIYSIVGSMVFIYGINLFKKESILLKF